MYAAARWAGNKPASERRGLLKWVFIGLILAGTGVALVPSFIPKLALGRPGEAPRDAQASVPL